MALFSALIKKEFILVGRSLGGIVSLFTLSISVIFILYSSIEVNEALSVRSVRGLKWAIIFILNFVIISQSLWEERESGGFEVSQERHSILTLYLAKTFIVWICTCIVNAALILVMVLFFKNMDVDRFLGEWFFANLGSLSLIALGISLGVISAESKLKEVIIPLLQLPFSIPLLLFGLEAEARFWMEPGFYFPSVGLLLVFAVFYLGIGALFLEVIHQEN